MATKEQFLASIQRQKDERQSKEVTRNQISSEIGKLIGEGDLSGAYAKFEELPIIEQISLSIAPGIGDALAAYEVKEFGSRGIQNIREGNVLGGLGNFLFSGLAGASLIPILRAGRGLTRVARMGDDMGGGPSSMVEFMPNEYLGTRPSENITGSFGLKSPNREALQKMDQPKKLGSVMAIKKAKARRGSTMKIKRAFTKRTASPSVRLGRLNKQRASRNRPARRSMAGRRMGGTRKAIRTR